MKKLNYIDLFAGAGGLSEGFIKEGFEPVAHVEMSKSATDTLKTRLVYHYLVHKQESEIYNAYLRGEISRNQLWSHVPDYLLKSVINREITDQTIDEIFSKIDVHDGSDKVNVLVGGPPCQAYSIVGRSRDPNRMEGDKRNYLFRYYGEFLKKYEPDYFVFENVLGLLTAGNKIYLNEMLKMFNHLEYSVDYRILDAAEFGVLQKRQRVIIIGKKGKSNFKFPDLSSHNIKSFEIKKDLFYDLPFLKHGQELGQIVEYTQPISNYLAATGIRNGVSFVTQHIARPHNERDLKIYYIAIEKWIKERKRLLYSDVPEELRTHNNITSFLDRFKVVDPFGLSHTVVAHIAKDGHYYIYPDLNQVRSLSVREAARIQSFPDDYYFEGGRTPAFRQIGNAVPPLMAQAIARKLKELI